MSSAIVVTADSARTVLASAVSQNQISAATVDLMTEQLDDIGLAGCQGIAVEDLDSEQNTLVTVIIDASSSMWEYRDAVIKAYNEQFLRPLKGASNKDSILVSCWIFSGHGPDAVRLVHGYKPIDDCPDLDGAVYDPYGSTPLWEAVQRGLTGILVYGQTLKDAGSQVKHIIVCLTDGEENASAQGITAAKIQKQSADVLKQETFVLALAFFGDESEGDGYADEIGFPRKHRITAGLNDSEIRRIFETVSSSVISTSQAVVGSNISANAFFATP